MQISFTWNFYQISGALWTTGGSSGVITISDTAPDLPLKALTNAPNQWPTLPVYPPCILRLVIQTHGVDYSAGPKALGIQIYDSTQVTVVDSTTAIFAANDTPQTFDFNVQDNDQFYLLPDASLPLPTSVLTIVSESEAYSADVDLPYISSVDGPQTRTFHILTSDGSLFEVYVDNVLQNSGGSVYYELTCTLTYGQTMNVLIRRKAGQALPEIVSSFTRNRNQIVLRVLRILGVIQEGKQPTAAQWATAIEAFDCFIRALQEEGAQLWLSEWVTRPLSTAASSVLATDGKSYRCLRNHTSAGANEPGVGSDWTTYWTETATASTTPWAIFTAYTSPGHFEDADAAAIEQAFIREADGTDTGLSLISTREWGDLPNKSDDGLPRLMLMERTLAPSVMLYPLPDLTTYVLHYRRIRYLSDFASATATGDFPSSWIDAIVFGLAHRLSFEYGVPLQEREQLRAVAVELKRIARGFNDERPTSNRVRPCY